MNATRIPAPTAVRVLAALLFLFGLMALLGSLFLWGRGLILTFPAGVDYSYPVTDILVNAPACMVAALGMWKLRRYGYVASQFVAGLFIYASVEIFVQIAQGTLPMQPAILIPQIAAVILALFLVFYLWRIQDIFTLSPRAAP